MIDVADALRIVLEHAAPLGAERLRTSPELLGRIVAEDVIADIDSPPFTKALMDGYAVRTADTSAGPVELRVIEDVQAGGMPKLTVNTGEATAIYTGAPVPEGADAVVMKERCERISSDRVRVNDPSLKPGKSILPRAAEMKVGDVVIPAGAILNPVTLGILAAVGRAQVAVIRSPKVKVLATGDELVEASEKPTGSQIRNTNGPMLSALAAQAGAKTEYFGIARDNEDSLRDKLGLALDCDILMLAGGVSAGKYDLVPGVLTSLGMQTHFHHVRMKPGKPLLFGTVEKTLVFGLPGNPASAFVAFHLFVKPALRKLSGHSRVESVRRMLPLLEPLKSNHDRPTYFPARIESGGVRPLPWFGSADLRGLLPVNALLELPVGEREWILGEAIPSIPLEP